MDTSLNDYEPTDEELELVDACAELEDEEEEALSVDQFLDRMDLDRMEADRLLDDLYPGVSDEGEGGEQTHVHRDTDPVQAWLARERQS
jgi:hypothetical protein